MLNDEITTDPTTLEDVDLELDRPSCRRCARLIGDHPDDLILSRICAYCDALDIEPGED